MPATWDDFQAYMLDMVEGEDLHVTDEARDLAVQIVMRPPVPLRMRPVLELANQITIGLLPPRLRRQYGFAWDPVRAVAIRGGAEYAKRFVVPLLPERLRLVRSARRAAVRSPLCVAALRGAVRAPRGVRTAVRGRVRSERRWRRRRTCTAPNRPVADPLPSLGDAVTRCATPGSAARRTLAGYRGCIPPSSDTTWLVM